MAKTPIAERIRHAMGNRTSMQYHALMDAVFPAADYPRAMMYQSNGGPPGCAMAFGVALRRLGMGVSGLGSHKRVSAPKNGWPAAHAGERKEPAA